MPRAKRTTKRVVTGTKPDGTPDYVVTDKAANGAGSVHYDKTKDRWRATWQVGPTGHRKVRSVVAATKAEAVERRAQVITAEAERPKAGDPLGAHPTVAELFAYWLDTSAAPNVRASTLGAYRKSAALIVDLIGAVPVADVTTDRVRSVVAYLRAEVEHDDGTRRPRYAVPTVKAARTALRQACDEACELGYLDGPNPVTRVPIPKPTPEERKPRRALDVDELRRLLDALDGSHPLDAVVGILFTSGCRVSEALGLSWDDVDLEAGTATIRRGCTHVSGRGVVLDEPKTPGTRGTVFLTPSAVELLKARRKQQAEERLAAGPSWQIADYEGAPCPLIFTGADGRPVARQHVHRHIRKVADRAGIDTDGLGCHTGRRTVVTLAYREGLAIDDVARLVGHAQTSTTAGYVQGAGSRPERVARQVAALLDPAAASE